jgi:Ca2+-transporting ATPase
MLDRSAWASIAWTGALQAAVVLAAFAVVHREHGLLAARDAAFTTLVFVELFRAFSARSPDRTFFQVGALSNLRLLAVVVGSAVVQLALHEIPIARTLLHLEPLDPVDAALALGLGLVPVSAIELAKLLRQMLRRLRRT